ncbi:unnamed protein product [Mytilus coruscus]|uniref:Reverse transcriptase zinc-binding domain-containing protein n=1 Tax=Mytilus coruscus TaxID=42192 RepID=A0A6J8EWD6_MYTCO|nr:unnamed protein product [Mytilus coruscus]
MNWKNKIKKVRSLLNMWLQRQLTLQGRVTVVNTLMLSRFWYTLFVTSMPEWAYLEIKRLCVNFIWDNRSHLVKCSSIADEKCKGGLQLSDIKCKMYAFRLKYIGRLIDDQYHVLWKDIFKYFASKIYGMQLGLEILYHCLLSIIPDEWKNTIDNNVHHRNIDRTIDISVLIKNVPCDLKSCNVKKLYQCVLEDITEEPIGPIIWKKLYALDEAELCKIWKYVYEFWKPSKMIELDYKIMHNCVFTNVKLKKIGLSDSELCDVCHKENEDIMHVFINCDELEDFHDYLSALLCKIFENCDSDKISLVQSEMLLLNGLRWKMKGVNDLFLNFVLSVARFCIFRRRNLLKNGHKMYI